MAHPERRRLTPLDLGIFTISLAILLLELLLTRIFSVVMYHHFSFLAISLAMTGLGLGGLLVHLRPRRFRADNIRTVAPMLSVVFALGVLVSAWVAFHMPIRLETSAANSSRVALVLVLSLVPLTAGGLIIAQILAYNYERANRLYCFDLLGAGLACLLFVPLTNQLGAPTALLVTAVIGLVGGALLAEGRGARRANGAGALALLVLSVFNLNAGFFDVQFTRGARQLPTLVTRWNSFSRVEVRGTPAEMERPRPSFAWGLSSQLRRQVRELHLLYDGGALTQIPRFDGDLSEVDYLLWDVTSAAHHARTQPRVLVIGAGGGRDLLTALVAGATRVTALEINDITVELMQGRFRDYTGGLYVDHPDVTVVNEDGRSFVRRTRERYDLIQASLVDTAAASSAGVYALTENSLYTVEAFLDFFARLEPDGMLSFSWWYDTPPVEVLKIVTLARVALERLGVGDPAPHLVVVRTNPELTRRLSLATILVRRSPFPSQELAALAAWADRMRFQLAYVPSQASPHGGDGVIEMLLGPKAEAADFAKTRPFDLSPTTDDRPFFFDRVPLLAWTAARLGLPAPARGHGTLPLGSQTLLVALGVTGASALLLFTLPMWLGPSRQGGPDGRRAVPQRLAWMLYFACLGLGYIIVEIVLIQRFNLYLGRPAYSLTVVLFTMLASSGLGALAAARWSGRAALIPMLLGVCLAIGAVALGLEAIIGATLAASAGSRMMTAAAFVAPVGFVMGMPFPSGLRQAGRSSESLASWAWAMNGGASVFGSVVAVVVSMTVGFSGCLTLATAVYALALGVAVYLVRSRRAA